MEVERVLDNMISEIKTTMVIHRIVASESELGKERSALGYALDNRVRSGSFSSPNVTSATACGHPQILMAVVSEDPRAGYAGCHLGPVHMFGTYVDRHVLSFASVSDT